MLDQIVWKWGRFVWVFYRPERLTLVALVAKRAYRCLAKIALVRISIAVSELFRRGSQGPPKQRPHGTLPRGIPNSLDTEPQGSAPNDLGTAGLWETSDQLNTLRPANAFD